MEDHIPQCNGNIKTFYMANVCDVVLNENTSSMYNLSDLLGLLYFHGLQSQGLLDILLFPHFLRIQLLCQAVSPWRDLRTPKIDYRFRDISSRDPKVIFMKDHIPKAKWKFVYLWPLWYMAFLENTSSILLLSF